MYYYTTYILDEVEVEGGVFSGTASVEYVMDRADRSIGYCGGVDFCITEIKGELADEDGDIYEFTLKAGDPMFKEVAVAILDKVEQHCCDDYGV